MEKPEQQSYSRLYCACTFTECAKSLEAQLEASKSKGGTISDLKRAVAQLKQLYHEHITIHKDAEKRALVELSKWKAINASEGTGGYLQTCAYKVGDLKRLRDPPKKKSKKEEAMERKKMKLQKKSTSGGNKKVKINAPN